MLIPILDAAGNFTGQYENSSPSPPNASPQSKDDAKTPNSAPAKNGRQVNIHPTQAPAGNGQKPTKTSATNPNNPNKPNPRLWNPLSKFSSYTYSLTFYMVTPEALNYFTINGRLPTPQNTANGYYFIVAESGGISVKDNRALTIDPQGAIGAGKPGLDFFIDEMNFEVLLVAAGGQKTATIGTSVNFQITEPIGYTLLTKMMKASTQINALSSIVGTDPNGALPNLYQQHYMFGIKFYGYDENGAIVKSSDPFAESESFEGDPYALYARLFPLTISNINFKIDGRATVYNVEAVTVPHQVAFGKKHGKVPTNTELQGATVGEVLGYRGSKNNKSLMYQLNEIQSDYNKNNNIKTPNKYEIEWVKTNFFDSTVIKNSPMTTDAEFERSVAAMAPVSTVQQSNVQRSEKAKTADKNSKLVGLSPGTSIPMVIDQIISKSKYIVDTLLKENNSRIETQTKENDPNLLTWYAIHPSIECTERDSLTRDWVYNITYQIVPYQVPYVKSQYVTARSTYYGPVKQYSYLLTGENTEVISIDLTYNNLFYMPQPASTTKDNSSQNNKSLSPATPTSPTNSIDSTQGGAGVIRGAGMISDSVRSSLYSLGDQMTGTLTIMGDPDFLMDAVGKKINNITSFGKFYGQNNSVNPYGGQIFLEIIYDVAEDYKENGLLDVDPNYTLQFYPLEITKQIKNKGLIYRINKVLSTFSKGKFTQTMDIMQVPISELIVPEQNKVESQREQTVSTEAQQTPTDSRNPSRTTISNRITALDQSQAETARLQRQARPGKVSTGNAKDDAVINTTRRGNVPQVGLSRLAEELRTTVRDDIRGGGG